MATGDPTAFPTVPCQVPGATCQVHSLVETIISENRADVKELREMFTHFMATAAEEHTAIRQEILEMAKHMNEFMATRLGPHPTTRSDDTGEKIILQLSRGDFWKATAAIGIVILFLVGLALVAGREGLVLWKHAAETVVKTAP